jgi:hypothetical protein
MQYREAVIKSLVCRNWLVSKSAIATEHWILQPCSFPAKKGEGSYASGISNQQKKY